MQKTVIPVTFAKMVEHAMIMGNSVSVVIAQLDLKVLSVNLKVGKDILQIEVQRIKICSQLVVLIDVVTLCCTASMAALPPHTVPPRTAQAKPFTAKRQLQRRYTLEDTVSAT
jgi:hypothetical protein